MKLCSSPLTLSMMSLPVVGGPGGIVWDAYYAFPCTLLSQAEPESPASIGSQIANTFNFAFG